MSFLITYMILLKLRSIYTVETIFSKILASPEASGRLSGVFYDHIDDDHRLDASGEAKILEKIVSTASSLGKTVLIINFPFPIVSDSFFGFHYSLAFSNVNIKRGNFLISILHRCKLKII